VCESTRLYAKAFLLSVACNLKAANVHSQSPLMIREPRSPRVITAGAVTWQSENNCSSLGASDRCLYSITLNSHCEDSGQHNVINLNYGLSKRKVRTILLYKRIVIQRSTQRQVSWWFSINTTYFPRPLSVFSLFCSAEPAAFSTVPFLGTRTNQ
jgi:hypothetical protein